VKPRKDLRVGDLVRYGSTTPENRSEAQKRIGVIVEDYTMTCTHGGVEPYKMGAMMVMWAEGIIERVVYECLELINGN
tara:strand:- start:370 stop:603 length:234 start_codon:yes stop_codon:yes gene_type:complete